MAPGDVAGLLARDYLIAAYLGAMGTIQLAAAAGGLRGLLFLPRIRLARWLGAGLIVAGLAYFFLAPLWTDGPWSTDPTGAEVRGAEGRTVRWGRAAWSELPRARNINDIDGGLSGTDQALWFPVASGAALLSTLILSSLVNWRLTGAPVRSLAGFDALSSNSWPRALRGSLQRWRAEWRGELETLFDDDREWALVRRIANRRRRKR